MLVHSCTVDDGKGDRVDILDQNGCAVDRYVLNNIEYPEDLLAGQEAHVYKYADRESLYYQCQISIQVKESGDCVRPKCPDLLSSSPVTIFNKTRQEQVPASVQDGVSLPVNRFRSSMEHYNRGFMWPHSALESHKVRITQASSETKDQRDSFQSIKLIYGHCLSSSTNPARKKIRP